MGGKCVKCGFRDSKALQIDHVNGGGNEHRRRVSWVTRYRDILSGADTTCQLLCANCNWIKRADDQELRATKITQEQLDKYILLESKRNLARLAHKERIKKRRIEKSTVMLKKYGLAGRRLTNTDFDIWRKKKRQQIQSV